MSSYSGDAADQVLKMTLEGTDVALRLAGSGAKELAVLIYAVLKDQKRTRGRTRLVNMLKSGKELRVFAVNDSELRKFCAEAKRYGVLYTVLKDRSAGDGITDIMVRSEDAGKISRIFQRFDLARVDIARVRESIEREREERGSKGKDTDPGVFLTDREKTEKFLDDVLRKEDGGANPTQGRTGQSLRSAPSSERSSATERDAFETGSGRPSVKRQLEELRREAADTVRGRSTGRRKRSRPAAGRQNRTV